ncbi:MAG: hypothetical protein VX529_14945 [Pseudomonadota bacterium]|nr:hypothetical protein [Pseudomonadota bacterium]
MEIQSPSPQGQETDGRLSDILAFALSQSGDQPAGCDTAAYLTELDGLDVPPEQKIEFIHRLWVLIETLVRIQFRLDPVSDALRAQDYARATMPPDVVESGHSLNSEFDAVRGEGR